MPDMQDAMKKAGFSRASGEIRCGECGKTFVPSAPEHKVCPACFQKKRGGGRSRAAADAGADFPPGYPEYFDSDGLLKPEYVTVEAEKIAQALGRTKPRMTMHQLRAFYHHVKRQEGALKNGQSFREVLVEVSKLKPFASERASKDKIPAHFEQFIIRNVDKAKDEKTFLRGFVEHFQAVVAYCAGTLER